MSGLEEYAICPYNAHHIVKKYKMFNHVSKCKKRYEEKQSETCTFSSHGLPKKNYSHLLATSSINNMQRRTIKAPKEKFASAEKIDWNDDDDDDDDVPPLEPSSFKGKLSIVKSEKGKSLKGKNFNGSAAGTTSSSACFNEGLHKSDNKIKEWMKNPKKTLQGKKSEDESGSSAKPFEKAFKKDTLAHLQAKHKDWKKKSEESKSEYNAEKLSPTEESKNKEKHASKPAAYTKKDDKTTYIRKANYNLKANYNPKANYNLKANYTPRATYNLGPAKGQKREESNPSAAASNFKSLAISRGPSQAFKVRNSSSDGSTNATSSAVYRYLMEATEDPNEDSIRDTIDTSAETIPHRHIIWGGLYKNYRTVDREDVTSETAKPENLSWVLPVASRGTHSQASRYTLPSTMEVKDVDPWSNLGKSRNSRNSRNFGNSGNPGNSGNYGNSGNSGNFGNSGNSGNFGNFGNSGNSGNSGNFGNSGNSSNGEVKNENKNMNLQMYHKRNNFNLISLPYTLFKTIFSGNDS